MGLLDGKVVVVDENGGVATVVQADLLQSNGVIHVTDAVSLPARAISCRRVRGACGGQSFRSVACATPIALPRKPPSQYIR